MDPRSESRDRSERPAKGNFDRFGASRRDKPRREQPPPQPWDVKKAPDEEEQGGEAPAQSSKFDARAVLDRLWKERGGGKKR